MDGVLLRVAAWARTRWRAALVVALLVGVAAGAVFALGAGARRTASAPDRYTEAVGGDPDLVVLQPLGPPLTTSVEELPGVADVRAITFVAAFPTLDGELAFDLNPFAGDDRSLGGRVLEGRFTDPTRPDEFTVGRTAFELLDVEVGQRFQVKSFSQEQAEQNAFRPDIETEGPTFEATLVGVIGYPSDLDEPQPTIVFSAATLAAQPDVAVIATFMAVYADAGIAPASILAAIQDLPGGTDVFEEEGGRVVSAGARRAVRLQVTALWIVAAVAAVVGALIAGQLIARHTRVAGAERDALRALGYGRGHAVAEATAQAVLIGVLASVVAAGIAFAASPVFPIGVLRSLEPDTGVAVDVPLLLLGAGALIAVLAVCAGSTAYRAARPAPVTSPSPHRLPDVIAAAGASPSLVNGVRFAVGSPGRGRGRPIAVAASVIIGVTGLVGSLLVGSSLIRMIGEPALWGANYDRLFGNEFVPTERDIVTPVIDDPDIAALSAATIGTLTMDGIDVPVFAFEAVRGGLLPVIVDGRAPSGADEVALGRVVARRLGLEIGDTVVAEGPTGASNELAIVGYVTTPTEAGDGASMTYEAFSGLVPDATRNLLLVRYREGAPNDVVDARISELAFSPPDTTAAPTTVQAFDRVVPAPFVLAGVLAAMAVIALAYHLASSVRGRRRDLVILRALGANRRQLRATVHWQACCVAGVGLLVGVPAGIVVGSRIHASIADSVGVVSSVAVPVVSVLVVIAGVLAVANVAAVLPARRAARSPAAELQQD